jgi:oligoendopeptidase F
LKKPLQQTWDLEILFPGGSESQAFQDYLTQIEHDIPILQDNIENIEPSTIDVELKAFEEVIQSIQDISIRVRQSSAFVSCLSAQNMKDKKAVILGGRVKSAYTTLLSTLTLFDQLLITIDDTVWETILLEEPFKQITFPLNERRTQARDKLSPEQETLINDLSLDGYHGWGDLYNTIVGRMSIPLEDKGKSSQLSVGQAANKLSSTNLETRRKMAYAWEEAWASNADYCADALNHLAGFRLQVYKHRKWESIHREPLSINRMAEQTLKTMWNVIDKNKDIFLSYFERKAKLLGLPALGWHDVDVPIGKTEKKRSYDEAAQFIIEHFRRFSPKMADFTVNAFEKDWIEAEDRPGKRPGGFCTSLPDSEETRIFMTFSGTASNISTLAHELGHAYHQHVMNDMPAFSQRYAMNVAETASTFAEMIVADAAVKHASNEAERLVLLEDKIQRSVAFFMNIHARFIFETNFYSERKKGLVGVDKLNELMVTAQKHAFKNSLNDYHPHFWASKLHFYITSVPFYNFPYTFGYLFSSGIYARALQGGNQFEDRYIALLRDTGSMSVEDLAQKHLKIDLTQPDFWQEAVDLAVADVQEFLELTK